MYEIWLVLNILWELALSVWPTLLILALAWVLLLLLALVRGGAWRRSFTLALGLGVVVALALIPLVPGAVGSSLAEMGYWVDWANLLAICGGFGAAVFALAWPMLAAARPKGAH
jgi:hypothetical protein